MNIVLWNLLYNILYFKVDPSELLVGVFKSTIYELCTYDIWFQDAIAHRWQS